MNTERSQIAKKILGLRFTNKISNQRIANLIYIKRQCLKGKIRFHIPNTRQKVNYLPYFKNEAVERILLTQKATESLPKDIQLEIIKQVLIHYNNTLGWQHYK